METKLTPFIAIEGMDGSGKTTLVRRLREAFLSSSDHRYQFTREPGGTPAGETIRNVLLDGSMSAKADGTTQLLGFFYARAHHVKAIRAWREEGLTVITDRFDASTLAYQIFAQTESAAERKALGSFFWMLREKVIAPEDAPTLYLYLDLHPEVARARRAADSSQEQNHYDTRPIDFYDRQHNGYETFLIKIAIAGTSKIHRIDATKSPDEIYEEARRVILEHMVSSRDL